jgi:hypothetical protein
MNENSRQTQSHIDSIVKQEEKALERRSSSERFADNVGLFAGSLTHSDWMTLTPVTF